MAVEVEHGMYTFQPGGDFTQHLAPPAAPMENFDKVSSSSHASSEEPSQPSQPSIVDTVDTVETNQITPNHPVFFRHNTFHDLESMFWVFLFLFTKREIVIYDYDEAELKRKVKQHQLAAKLFHDKEARRLFLLETSCKEDLAFLHRSLHIVGQALEEWRLKLVAGYKNAEQDISSISVDSAHNTRTFIMNKVA